MEESCGRRSTSNAGKTCQVPHRIRASLEGQRRTQSLALRVWLGLWVHLFEHGQERPAWNAHSIRDRPRSYHRPLRGHILSESIAECWRSVRISSSSTLLFIVDGMPPAFLLNHVLILSAPAERLSLRCCSNARFVVDTKNSWSSHVKARIRTLS